MTFAAVVSGKAGIRFSSRLIIHVFHAKIDYKAATKLYFFMRLFLLDRWPLLNVRLHDASVDKQYHDLKIKWLRSRFFEFFYRMSESVAGNSRLFLRAQ